MAEFDVIRSFTMPDGHKIVSIRPDVMRRAIEAAATVGRETAKIGFQTIVPEVSGPSRDREP
jgi:hypothetical protein